MVRAAVQGHAGESISSATNTVGKGVRRSLRKRTNDVRVLAKEVKELIDPQDILKSLYRFGREESQWSSQNVIHKPIGCSKPLSKSLDSFHSINESTESGISMKMIKATLTRSSRNSKQFQRTRFRSLSLTIQKLSDTRNSCYDCGDENVVQEAITMNDSKVCRSVKRRGST